MNKIRKFLIKLLGGVTTEDAAMDYAVGYGNGHNDCLVIVLQKMQSLNGLSADEWCKQMYNYIKEHCHEENT